MNSVSCYHVVCRLYGNFKPYTASLLLKRKSKFSNEEKHTTSTVNSVARATCDSPIHQISAENRKSTDTGDCLKSQGVARLGLQQPQALNSNWTSTNKSRQEENQKVQKSTDFVYNNLPNEAVKLQLRNARGEWTDRKVSLSS